jgi:GT2 family glycosyltransferase
MKASIIIPACNNHGDVLRALNSLRRQVMEEGDVEIIVVDDGSRPPLIEMLKPEIDDRIVRIVRNDQVCGRSAARNRGVKASRGEILLFMDSDMTAHPDFIREHLAIHEERTPVACVGYVVWTGSDRIHRYLESRGVKKLKNGQAVPWRYLDSSNFSCGRRAFERAGSFYEGIRQWGGEDTLMGYELHANGVEITYRREAITYHHSRVDLEETCQKNYTFGRHSLPVMITVRPEIARSMRSHYMMPPSRDEGGLIKRWGTRIVVRGLLVFPGHRVVRALLPFTGESLSFRCYDYLVYSSILRGYRDYLREEGNPDDSGADMEAAENPKQESNGLEEVT